MPQHSRFRYGVAAGEITRDLGHPLDARTGSGCRDGPGLAESLACGEPARHCGGDARSVRSARSRSGSRAQPGSRYYYGFAQRRSRSRRGTFVTAPGSTTSANVRFAISGDADATPGDGRKARFQHLSGLWPRWRTRRTTSTSISATPSTRTARSPARRSRGRSARSGRKYRLGLTLPALEWLRRSAGLYSHWDDHEFINDFSRAEHGGAIYAAGVKAFTDYAPVAKPSANGLYRTFRWGKNLELFFLDERSFRSAKATQVCGGDLAPTAPQAVRDAFSTLAPGLKNPVAPACLAAINDPSRTMLGARQFAAFTKAIEASTATWKVIVNEVPIQQFYALPYDRWEGYAAERERLLRFLQANVRNVVFLTTDTHANLVNEVRYRTLGGAPEGTGIWEVVTGPVATNSFAKEIDGYLGQKGAGTAIGALFFKPPPPNGMGMRCAALDTFSYSEVSVTAKRLTVAMKDAKGRPVREATGVACAPLVLTAR